MRGPEWASPGSRLVRNAIDRTVTRRFTTSLTTHGDPRSSRRLLAFAHHESELHAMSTFPIDGPDGPPRYEIRLQGRLDPRWAAWFDGLTLSTADDGTTALRGPVADQAALHGVLQKVRDLGLPLLSVTRLHRDQPRSRPHVNPPSPERTAP